MIGRVDAPLGDLTVAGTALSFLPGWNDVAATPADAFPPAYAGPVVLMGDLNMGPTTPAG